MHLLCICVPEATPILLLETCLTSKPNYRPFGHVAFWRLKPVRLLGILVQLRGLSRQQLYSSGDFNQEPYALTPLSSFVLPSEISSLDMIFVPRELTAVSPGRQASRLSLNSVLKWPVHVRVCLFPMGPHQTQLVRYFHCSA